MPSSPCRGPVVTAWRFLLVRSLLLTRGKHSGFSRTILDRQSRRSQWARAHAGGADSAGIPEPRTGDGPLCQGRVARRLDQGPVHTRDPRTPRGIVGRDTPARELLATIAGSPFEAQVVGAKPLTDPCRERLAQAH